MNIEKNASEWWDELPIQNLENMSDSWVGYVYKYYPEKTDIYHLNQIEIKYIWLSKHIDILRKLKLDKLKSKMK
jgi:hypothetical protein